MCIRLNAVSVHGKTSRITPGVADCRVPIEQQDSFNGEGSCVSWAEWLGEALGKSRWDGEVM